MGGGEVTIGQRASWDPMLVGVGAAVSQSRARLASDRSRKTRGWQLLDRQKALESPECASARPNRGQVLSTRSPGPHVKGWKVPRPGMAGTSRVLAAKAVAKMRVSRRGNLLGAAHCRLLTLL